MAATPEQVARLRRMVNEPSDSSVYTREVLTSYIEAHPVVDARGEEPYTWQATLAAPTQVANPLWISSYDLHSAAADIWEEKASVVAQDFDFNADGGNYSRSQKHEQYMQQARYHRSRRNVRGLRVISPSPPVPSVIGNWNNPYE